MGSIFNTTYLDISCCLLYCVFLFGVFVWLVGFVCCPFSRFLSCQLFEQCFKPRASKWGHIFSILGHPWIHVPILIKSNSLTIRNNLLCRETTGYWNEKPWMRKSSSTFCENFVKRLLVNPRCFLLYFHLFSLFFFFGKGW